MFDLVGFDIARIDSGKAQDTDKSAIKSGFAHHLKFHVCDKNTNIIYKLYKASLS